jgi:hypothetical protein
MNNNIILLGDACSVSWLLDSCKIERETGLFEWCKGDNFSDVIYTINNIHNIDVEQYKLPGNVCIRGTDIYTSHYALNSFSDKVKRRSKRFIDMIKSNVELLFIRRDYFNTMLKIEELDEFDKSIKKINPDCNYKFLLLNTTGDLITYKNLIHKMVEVNTMEEPKENKKNSEDIALWKNIFEELGITLNI